MSHRLHVLWAANPQVVTVPSGGSELVATATFDLACAAAPE